MLRILSHCSLLLLCFLITGSQAAAVRDSASPRESPEAPPDYKQTEDDDNNNNDNGDGIDDDSGAFEIIFRFIFYTLDPIGGGNLVRAAEELMSSEDARDAGSVISRLMMIISDFEDKYPSIADKLRRALDELFIYGPVRAVTEAGAAEAREEITTPQYVNLFPLEAMIDAAMEEFHKAGGLPGIADMLVNYAQSGDSPFQATIRDIYTFIMDLFSA